MLVYIAGPYRGEIDQNIAQAREIAIKVWESGNVAICPHLNTIHFELDCSCTDPEYLQGDLEIVARCDAVLLTPNWTQSVGAKAEQDFAISHHIPVYVYPDMPTCHPTEIKRPQQCAAFMSTLMNMYRTHLDKNADYSPANILGVGEIGLVTRLWDKIARLLNLTGFKLEIASSSFEAPQQPKCESIDDAYMDLAVYGIIGLLLRQKVWGK